MPKLGSFQSCSRAASATCRACCSLTWVATSFSLQGSIRGRYILVPAGGRGEACSLAAPCGRAILAILAAAAASPLLVRAAPGYDPWTWLLWGREVASGTLSTADGPAFKPLPVAVCALLAPLGSAAPVVWVVLVRAAAGAALVLAYRLGRELARPPSTGSDPVEGRWRVGGGGRGAGGRVRAGGVARRRGAARDRGRAGRDRVLAGRAAARGAGARRGVRAAAGGGVAVPGAGRRGGVAARPRAAGAAGRAGACSCRRRGSCRSGSARATLLRSGARARIPNPGQPALADVPALASLWAAAKLLLVPLWLGVVLALREPRARALAAAGGAWVALVALMAQAGFSGEPRYALPGVALLAVAGAAGLARACAHRVADHARSSPTPGGVAPRSWWPRPRPSRRCRRWRSCGDVRDAQAHQWALARDLDAAVRAAGGREAVLACGRPVRRPLPRAADGLRARRDQAHGRARRGAACSRRRVPRAAHARLRARARRPGPPFRAAARVGEWEVLRSCAAN